MRLFALDLVDLEGFIDFANFTDFVELRRGRIPGSPRARPTTGAISGQPGAVPGVACQLLRGAWLGICDLGISTRDLPSSEGT